MPETRSGKLVSLADIITEKLNEFKEEVPTEIKLSIKSEIVEALKKQKEEFHLAFIQLQKHITKLENEKDDLEHNARRVCLRIEDVRVTNCRKNVVVLWFHLLVISLEHYFTEKELA